MTERTESEGGNPQEGTATDGDGQTRRTFLGAAALATGGVLASTSTTTATDTAAEFPPRSTGVTFDDLDGVGISAYIDLESPYLDWSIETVGEPEMAVQDGFLIAVDFEPVEVGFNKREAYAFANKLLEYAESIPYEEDTR